MQKLSLVTRPLTGLGTTKYIRYQESYIHESLLVHEKTRSFFVPVRYDDRLLLRQQEIGPGKSLIRKIFDGLLLKNFDIVSKVPIRLTYIVTKDESNDSIELLSFRKTDLIHKLIGLQFITHKKVNEFTFL